MRKVYTLVLLVITFTAKAQFVTIPDTNFVLSLNYYGLGSCFTGNQLDTTCPGVAATLSLTLPRSGAIRDFAGIEYFRNLQYLSIGGSNMILNALPPSLDTFMCYGLLTLPPLPPTMKMLVLDHDSLSSISSFPPSLTYLRINYAQITSLPNLPAGLEYMDVSQLPITTFPVLPSTLKTLIATFGYYGPGSLNTVPALPAGLEHFDITDQYSVTSLPALPSSLKYLGLTGVHISPFPALPANLDTLFIEQVFAYNTLPPLNANLKFLDCWGTQISTFPTLPAGLKSFFFGLTPVTVFPTLPAGLEELGCDNIPWTSLPAMPAGLTLLSVYNTPLTSLPPMPSTLRYLECGGNQLTSLPNLPDTMYYLSCYRNPQLMCLPHIRYVHQLDIYQTGISCLPGGLSYWSGPSHSAYPVCDFVNPNNCGAFWNIGGRVYFDGNNNCTYDTTDGTSPGVKVQLYDNGSLVQQMYSMGLGTYAFNVDGNFTTYTLQVDTSGIPLSLSCPSLGYDSAVLSSIDTVAANINFGLVCNGHPFDVGVTSIVRSRGLFPGTTVGIMLHAGDMAQVYGARCALGISGQVQVTFSGPVTFAGADSLALTPNSVSGNTVSWTVADFGTVDYARDFNFKLNVDTTAGLDSLVCITVSVTPVIGDNNPGNNSWTTCFRVGNSLDPNEKEVYPSGTIDSSQKWLTYTIHFQNTGTAAAQHIYVTDTLDSDIDVSSFQLLAYSHQPLVQLRENAVRFDFLNINLPDGNTNEPLSHGYVQYKVKLKDNLPIGTQISNTAFIYFDFNAPVVTNTTTNTIAVISSLGDMRHKTQDVRLFPNPANDRVTISIDESMIGAIATVSDITGRKMAAVQLQTPNTKLQTDKLASGAYFVTVADKQGEGETKKLMIQK
jgi:hypothetical protein